MSNLIGILSLSTSYVVMIITFIHAYINDFETIVTINTIGEANLELILILISIPFTAKYLITQLGTKPK